jgi:hypothetical protein
MTPSSPLSFDRITHPDGSYFPTAYPASPVTRTDVYGSGSRRNNNAGVGTAMGMGGAALVGAGVGAAGAAALGHHRNQSISNDPFADDPRQRGSSDSGHRGAAMGMGMGMGISHGRGTGSEDSSFSSNSDFGTTGQYGQYAHRPGFALGPSPSDDPSYVFGESFLSPGGAGMGRGLGRMPTAGGTYPPLVMAAPALAHASSVIGARNQSSSDYESAASEGLGSNSNSNSASSLGHPIVDPAVKRQSSQTNYGPWLTGGMAGIPAGQGHLHANRDSGFADESPDLGMSSTQYAAHSAGAHDYAHDYLNAHASNAPLAVPAPPFASHSSGGSGSASGSGRSSSFLETIPEGPAHKEAHTPSAVADRGDYRPARRLSVSPPHSHSVCFSTENLISNFQLPALGCKHDPIDSHRGPIQHTLIHRSEHTTHDTHPDTALPSMVGDHRSFCTVLYCRLVRQGLVRALGAVRRRVQAAG